MKTLSVGSSNFSNLDEHTNNIQMKILIFFNLVWALSSFQLQAQQIRYSNGKTAWDGTYAKYENGNTAWNGTYAKHENGGIAWDGTYAKHENGRIAWDGAYAKYKNGGIAWDGTYAKHENGRTAFDGTYAKYDNGNTLAGPLYSQIKDVKLNGLALSELEVSDKIKLLTKTFNNRVYVVGLKIRLSEKNSILIDRENKLATNLIQLNKDIRFEAVNHRAKLSVLGQNVVNQK